MQENQILAAPWRTFPTIIADLDILFQPRPVGNRGAFDTVNSPIGFPNFCPALGVDLVCPTIKSSQIKEVAGEDNESDRQRHRGAKFYAGNNNHRNADYRI